MPTWGVVHPTAGSAVQGSVSGWAEVQVKPMPRFTDCPRLGETVPHTVMCPVCGHHVTVRVDVFSGNQSYFEDCPLCCRSIELKISVREYRVTNVEVERPF